jgi:hypothetical protein
VDIDEATAVLYGGSPEDFVVRRTALVTQARATRDRPLAKAIGALRRPTRSAWLVNLLAREAAGELAALLDLGEALQTAQAELAGDDLRRLSRERSRAVAGLSQRAAALGTQHGWTASDAALQEVSQTLQAALADQEVASDVRGGRVAQAASYGGFGPGGWGSALPTPVESAGSARSESPEAIDAAPADPELPQAAAPATKEPKSGAAEPGAAEPGAAEPADAHRRGPEPALPGPPPPEPAPPDPAPTDPSPSGLAPADPEREQRRLEARQAAEHARQEFEEAEAAAEAATVRADELAERLEDLRQQVRDTETAEREAREAARAARKRLPAARKAAARAERTQG